MLRKYLDFKHLNTFSYSPTFQYLNYPIALNEITPNIVIFPWIENLKKCHLE